MSTLVADGQIELAVEAGIGRQAERGVWDTSSWDQCVWGQSDTSLGDWVDVTCSVVDDSLELGAGSDTADGVVTRWEAATAAFTLVGADWNPWQGPYAGLLGPALPVRVRWRVAAASGRAEDAPGGVVLQPQAPADLVEVTDAGTWYCAFTGATDDEGYTWEPAHEDTPHLSVAQVAATDDTAVLVDFDGVEQNPQGAGETAAARVTRILDYARWPADKRDITAGGAVLQATTLAQSAWPMLLQVADTDLGLVWVRRDGFLAYRPQGRVQPLVQLAATLSVCAPDSSDRFEGQGSFEAGIAGFVLGLWQGQLGTLAHEKATPLTGAGSLRVNEKANGGSEVLRRANGWETVVGRDVFLTQPGQVWICSVTIRALAAVGAEGILARLLFGAGPADCWNLFQPNVCTIVAFGSGPLTAGQTVTYTAEVTTPAARHYVTAELFAGGTKPGVAWAWLVDEWTLRPKFDPNAIQVVSITGGQPRVVRNIVSISRQARDEADTPVTVTVYDTASASRYRARSYARTDLIHDQDAWSTTIAQSVLAQGAWPSQAPAAAELSSRLGDVRAASLLLGLEPSSSLKVTDQATTWTCAPAGWKTRIGRAEIAGTVNLLDVGVWIAGHWDSAVWDLDTWGV